LSALFLPRLNLLLSAPAKFRLLFLLMTTPSPSFSTSLGRRRRLPRPRWEAK
jgi:hypothetical protein